MKLIPIKNNYQYIKNTSFKARKTSIDFYTNMTGQKEKDENPRIPLGAYFNPVIQTTLKNSKIKAEEIKQQAETILDESKKIITTSQQAKEKAYTLSQRILQATQQATQEVINAKSKNDFSPYVKPDGTIVSFVSKDDGLIITHSKNNIINSSVKFCKTKEVIIQLKNEDDEKLHDIFRISGDDILAEIGITQEESGKKCFSEEFYIEAGELKKYSKEIKEEKIKERQEEETYYFINNNLESCTMNLQLTNGCSLHNKSYCFDENGNLRNYARNLITDSKDFRNHDEIYAFKGENNSNDFAYTGNNLHIIYENGKLKFFKDYGKNYSSNKKEPKTQLLFENGKLKAYFINEK